MEILLESDRTIMVVKNTLRPRTGHDDITESEQRELLVWFKSNKPELLREIFCEDCPEHMEYLDSCENKVERGK